MYKLDLEKSEEPDIKWMQHLLDHRKSKRIKKKKVYFCLIDYAKI